MTYAQVELEPFRDGRLERRDTVEQINGFSPGSGVSVVNERFAIEHQRKRENEIVVFRT